MAGCEERVPKRVPKRVLKSVAARTCLRNHPEQEIGDQSDHFILFGQHAADKASLRPCSFMAQVTLEQMCGEGEMEGQLRMLEDGGRFLDVKMAPRRGWILRRCALLRPEHFLGRSQTIHEAPSTTIKIKEKISIIMLYIIFILYHIISYHIISHYIII